MSVDLCSKLDGCTALPQHEELINIDWVILAATFIYILTTTYSLLHTTYYILHTTYYILPTTYYILPTTYILTQRSLDHFNYLCKRNIEIGLV